MLILFPHQLFKEHVAFSNAKKILLVEEYLFFRQYNFHKQKLVFHRASMKAWQAMFIKRGYDVEYVEATSDKNCDIREVIASLSKNNIKEIEIIDPTDNWLLKRINQQVKKSNLKLTIHRTALFLTDIEDAREFYKNKKTFFQTDFYIWQRKRLKIMLEQDGSPMGGKWSFDSENRKKLPKKIKIPRVNFPKANKFVIEAKDYVNKNFSKNYGEIDTFIYPVNHADADAWFDEFLSNRFNLFGDYEDAMSVKEDILFHSVISPLINVGLLSPSDVVGRAVAYALKNKIPINSLEGFIRQIIGWREFIRVLYELVGTRQRTTNFWKFNRKIPNSFWTAETKIDPIDIVISKNLKTAFNHHIERLMVLGNFFLLCEFDPDQVYRWFMEMYIDSYDWVMVPNVYGMTQFADGGLMATKPYISGSNYLMKMGDWPKGEWQEIWNGLFWHFMHTKRDFFLKNPRLGMLIKTFDKMNIQTREQHLKIARNYLDSLSK
jgi:deoxyribodipyrimidine photolyase-related protein